MQRTQGPNQTAGNLFTDGNPGTGTPATVIDAVWLNSVQEEVVSVILAASIALDVAQNNQLLKAIQILSNAGAIAAQLTQTITNNQVTAANITGLSFASGSVRSFKALVSCYIQTDAPAELQEVGTLYGWFNPVASAWQIRFVSVGDDCGVTFSITTGGQVQYTSTNQPFTSTYVGQMRISNVATLAV